MEKMHVSREQTKITSNIASSWRIVMYSSNPGLTKVLSGGQVVTPEFFPVLVMGKRWSFQRVDSNDQVETWNRLLLPDDATGPDATVPAALSYG